MTIFGVDSVSKIPWLTPLAALSVSVVETLLANSAETVARVVVGHVDVVVAHARLAVVTWREEIEVNLIRTLIRMKKKRHIEESRSRSGCAPGIVSSNKSTGCPSGIYFVL